MIEFRDNESKFYFHMMDFSKLQKSNTCPTFTDHPKSCVNCHRRTELPIWDSYRTWPGVYGSANELYEKDEETAYENFLHSAGKERRYQALRRFPAFVGEKENDAVRGHYSGLDGSHITGGGQLESLLYKWREHQLHSIPNYNSYQYALLGISYCTNSVPIDRFLPASMQGDFNQKIIDRLRAQKYPINPKKPVFQNLLDATLKAQIDYLATRMERRAETLDKDRNAFSAHAGKENLGEANDKYQETAALRYLIEGQGISMEDWFLPFTKYSYDAFRYSLPWEEEKAILNGDPTVAAAVEKFREAQRSGYGKGEPERKVLCELLRQRSVNEFRKKLGKSAIKF